jgi:hypothetical protein
MRLKILPASVAGRSEGVSAFKAGFCTAATDPLAPAFFDVRR